MVRGIELFKEYFAAYSDKYVLIGGAACTVIMENAGLAFRATKDLDIVLCVEALDAEFVQAFWTFVRAGRYQNTQQSTGKKLFYRFSSPVDEAYPAMLELFSRAPDVLAPDYDGHLTPMPIDEEISSLSAIILDDAYYHFINEGRQIVDDLPLIGAEYMIPLKARAWLDMMALKEQGVDIQSSDIRKHRNDIIRLYQLLTQDTRIELPKPIIKDMRQYLDSMAEEQIDVKGLGLRGITVEEIFNTLKQIYGL